MNDDAGLDELARRYLDFWQDQVSALAADDEMATAMARLLSAMGPAAAGAAQPWLTWPMAGAAWPGMAPGMGPGMDRGTERSGPGSGETPAHDGGQRRDGPSGDSTAGAAGSAADGPAPGHGDVDLGELARRLGALEARIAALEGGPRGRKAASGGPRKRKS